MANEEHHQPLQSVEPTHDQPKRPEPTCRELGKVTLSDADYDQIIWPCGD